MCSICCGKSRKKAPLSRNKDGTESNKSIDDPHGHGQEDDHDGFAMDNLFDFIDDYSSGSDIETDEPPHLFERPRGSAVCAEVYGAWNQRRTFFPPKYEKSDEDKAALGAALTASPLFCDLARDEDDLDAIVNAISIEDFPPGDKVVQQGDKGDAVYVILRGGADCYVEPEDADKPPPELPDSDRGVTGTKIATLDVGTVFGELAILWNVPRSCTVYGKAEEGCSVGRLDRNTHQNLVVHRQMDAREVKYQLIKKSPMMEMLKPEELMKLVDIVKLRMYDTGENLITQNEAGNELFILLQGEAVTKVATYWLGIEVDVQEHRKYYAGGVFGERALLRGDPRAASIVATVDNVKALVLSRGKFERLLGPMSQMQEGQYLADPRKLIADFYNPGDKTGPKGALMLKDGQGEEPPAVSKEDATAWFAVYRPTSRDAISKMLSGHAVGKGLNVKGKSAKKGVLSGFVPFLQISENEHKEKIETAPPSSRIKLYFRSKHGRDDAMSTLYGVMYASNVEVESKTITPVEDYAPNAFGLELPEPVLIQAYIKNPNIVPRVGWETGRASEPAFMDLNMHAIRGKSEPQVCLMQFDEEDPMNPRGLLIAYAEEFVKPVVSDFDTFTVGSRGMKYEPLPIDQAELATWALTHTKAVLSAPGEVGWTGRWLEILKVEGDKGFHPEFPKYGFGDPTSYGLIGDVVNATISCGAVRHGAECFNFYFPQELDDEYLVVWEGFPDKPWDYKNEAGLREFLAKRIEENFTFPLNPVWPVRDKGWSDILDKMLANPGVKEIMSAWDPSGKTISTIQELHNEFPDGFYVLNKDEPEERNRSTVPDMFGEDLMGSERTELAEAALFSHSRLKKAMTKVKLIKNLKQDSKVMTPETTAEPPDGEVEATTPVATKVATPESTTEMEQERRYDGSDGPYTYAEFEEFYGKEVAMSKWENAEGTNGLQQDPALQDSF